MLLQFIEENRRRLENRRSAEIIAKKGRNILLRGEF